MALPTSTATFDNLSKLASKPGVQSTLILSKTDGSIIRSTGLLAPSSPPLDGGQADHTLTNGNTYNNHPHPADYSGEADEQVTGKSAEDVAKMVFAFVSGAKAFADGVDQGDEVKLLRMRTKRSEIVIVPDTKFLLVVFHDTPPA